MTTKQTNIKQYIHYIQTQPTTLNKKKINYILSNKKIKHIHIRNKFAELYTMKIKQITQHINKMGM